MSIDREMEDYDASTGHFKEHREKGLSVMSNVRIGCALLQVLFLVGCSTTQSMLKNQALAGFDSSNNVVSSTVSSADLSPRFPSSTDDYQLERDGPAPPMLYPGSDPQTSQPPPSGDPEADQRSASADPNGDLQTSQPPPGEQDGEQRTASAEPVMLRGDGVEMNFEGTDIASAAKALLGDILHQNFEIDPQVQGSVTLASVGPIPRKDVLPTFEDVLRMQDAAIVHDGSFLKIVPVKEAAAHASISVGAGEPGFGVSVVPLRYVSAATVAKTADNLLGRAGAIRVDKARNLLLVQGTESEREASIDIISTFDVEWLRDQSVGVYPLKSTSPDSMIQELQQVFEVSNGGPGEGVIQFQPISRMNAVMVVTKNPEYLKETTRWIERLDRSDPSGTTVRTYHLKYGDASQIVKILSNIFGSEQSGASEESPLKQIAPGSTTARSRLDSLDSGTQAGNGTGQLGTAATPSAGTPGATTSTPSISAAFDAFSDNKGADANGSRGDGSDPAAGGGSLGTLKNVRITADAANNAVLVYSNQEDYKAVERALRDLDRPRLEVAIDATVAEVTLTKQLQYGTQYFLSSNSASLGLFSNVAQTAASTALQQVAPGFNLLLGSQSNPKVILSALSSITDVKVLSSPSIVAMDNEPALLQVGDEVPISTGSATILSSSTTPIVNTIQLYNTGIILKVLPHINANGSIELEIEQEVSGVVNSDNSQSTLTPTISERRIHSTVSVQSGQTVLLGGLISDNTQNTNSGIPGLTNLKFLGALFGTINDNNTRSEIIIFVRPQLIQNSLDARAVTEEFREKLQSMRSAQSVVRGESADHSFANLPPR
jgi:general secretion pathway protein D